MKITSKIFFLALFTAAFSSQTYAKGLNDQTLEVVISKPRQDVSIETLLKTDKKMEQVFVSKQPGYISREVGVAKDGTVIAIVHWKTMHDAEQAAQKFMENSTAAERVKMSDTSLFSHYIIQK